MYKTIIAIAFLVGCEPIGPVETSHSDFIVAEFQCDPQQPLDLPEGARIISAMGTDGDWTGHLGVLEEGGELYTPYCTDLVRISYVQ